MVGVVRAEIVQALAAKAAGTEVEVAVTGSYELLAVEIVSAQVSLLVSDNNSLRAPVYNKTGMTYK